MIMNEIERFLQHVHELTDGPKLKFILKEEERKRPPPTINGVVYSMPWDDEPRTCFDVFVQKDADAAVLVRTVWRLLGDNDELLKQGLRRAIIHVIIDVFKPVASSQLLLVMNLFQEGKIMILNSSASTASVLKPNMHVMALVCKSSNTSPSSVYFSTIKQWMHAVYDGRTSDGLYAFHLMNIDCAVLFEEHELNENVRCIDDTIS